jgi:hypothetical protein
MHKAYRKWCTLNDLGWDPHIKSTASVHSTNWAGSSQITSLNASNQKECVCVCVYIYMSLPR